MKTRLGGAGVFGLLRLGNNTELLHHSQHIYLDPALHDLALPRFYAVFIERRAICVLGTAPWWLYRKFGIR
jgi:hypothetical protein